MDRAVRFHGHSCPGLAIGVRVAEYVLDAGCGFAVDEELVAVAENDNCSVDALQALLGTTFGKGNLIFLDYGKNNYSIYSRTDRKAVRLEYSGRNFRDAGLSKEERTERIFSADFDELFTVRQIEFCPPEEATIWESVACEDCGQFTMSTRIVLHGGRKLCMPCSRKY